MRISASLFVGTFGGVGLAPGAPGTYAGMAAMGIHLLLARTAGVIWLLPLLAAATALGIALAPVVERELGRHDPGQFVLDEAAGYWLTAALLSAWPIYIVAPAGLVLFRVFDIFKPWPIKLTERLPRGWGVMLDDWLAGAMAAAVIAAALTARRAWGWA